MQFKRKGNGTPIVFLPGLFAGGWIWDAVASSCLEEGFSTITFDDAIPVIFGNHFRQAIKVLDMVLEECEEKPFLIGNSLGALISLHYALQNPTRIQGLVMSGAPGLVELEAGVQLSQLHTGEIQYAHALVSNVIYDKSKIPQRGIEEVARLFGDRGVFNNIARWLSLSRKYDIPEALQQLKALPIHFIWGEHDNITPAQPWVDLAGQFENIQASVILECGHSPMVELPQSFLEHLLPTLHRCRQSQTRLLLTEPA
ncbi:alpha/beta fold hydrolase [Iodobacter fluviatilis]|uniref:alpha/beta fold hydrolase n=1 Tax=Iodobacter fluviatilis TaxID=537 RepID=UPI0021CDD540|nr:alpha/beta hydrolase [Iodobacter fluviatilis]